MQLCKSPVKESDDLLISTPPRSFPTTNSADHRHFSLSAKSHHTLPRPLWANHHQCSSLRCCHFSQIDRSSSLHLIHLQSSSHSRSRGPELCFVASVQISSSHSSITTATGIFCTAHGFTATLRWCHNVVLLLKSLRIHVFIDIIYTCQITEFDRSLLTELGLGHQEEYINDSIYINAKMHN